MWPWRKRRMNTLNPETCIRLRTERGWSKRELARRANLSHTAIYKFENNLSTAERSAAMIEAAFRGESLNLPPLQRGGIPNGSKPKPKPKPTQTPKSASLLFSKGRFTGEVCRIMREQHGFSQVELAAQAGVGVLSLERFEGGSLVHHSVPFLLHLAVSDKPRKVQIVFGGPRELDELDVY